MNEYSVTMSEYLDSLSENTGQSEDNKHLTKEPGEDPKYSRHIKVAEWTDDYTYALNEIVNYDGTLYKSLQNSNINKQPDTETSWWQAASGGGSGSTTPNPIFSAGNFDYPSSNAAPREVINSGSITNITLYGQAFDDTTNETVEQSFEVPSDIDTSGTVTFYARGIAQTAATANIEFRFAHSFAGNGEDADVAFTNEDSGAKAVNTTQDYYTYFSWTETVSNLGWAANDSVKFQLTRLASGGNDTLTDDFYVTRLIIDIPRS